MPSGGWMVAGIALAVYVLARIAEAVLSMFNLNPVSWLTAQSTRLASTLQTTGGATNGVSGSAVSSPASGQV